MTIFSEKVKNARKQKKNDLVVENFEEKKQMLLKFFEFLEQFVRYVFDGN